MYLIGCFIILLFVLLYVYLKGNLTIKDLFVYLICIALSWVTLIAVVAFFLVIITVVTAEFWNTTIWKAKKKPKLSKKLDDLLN